MGLHRKWKWVISGASLIIVGVILVVLGVVIPKKIEDDIESRTKDAGVMNDENKKFWIATPPPTQQGQDPTYFFRDFRFITASNTNNVIRIFQYYDIFDVVVQAGLVRPEFQQLAALQYEQSISFNSKLVNQNNITIPQQFGAESYPGIQFQQDIKLTTDLVLSKAPNINVPNKGALTVWNWLKNAPSSRLALYGMYSAVDVAMGEYIDFAVLNVYLDKVYTDGRYSNFTIFRDQNLGNFNAFQQKNIWNDIVFGISNRNNLKYWKIACPNTELANEIKRDLMLSFGISDTAKFKTLLTQVCTNINQARTELNKQSKCVPYSGSAQCNNFDYAYAQWSSSALSLLISNNTHLCLDQINPTWLHGHFSMNAYINKTIIPEYSTKFPTQFTDSLLNFRPYSNDSGDFDYFYLFQTALETGSKFPPKTSLFNVQSLEMLIQLFNSYTEVVQTVAQGSNTLNLNHFQTVSDRLQLSKEQVFVIGHYLVNELIPNIWMNSQLASKNDVAYLSRWAPQTLQEGVLLSYMKVLPRALYAYGLYNIYIDDFNLTCSQVLTRILGANQITQAQTTKVCQNDIWNLKQGASWYKWVSVFIQGSDSDVAKQLYLVGGFTSSGLSNFFDQTKQFSLLFNSVEQTVYIYYGESVCGSDQGRKACPDSNLAIEQLLNSSITTNIPSFIKQGITPSKSIFTTFNNISSVVNANTFKQFQYTTESTSVDVNQVKQALFVMPHWNNFTYFQNLFTKSQVSQTQQNSRELIREVVAMQKLGGFFVTVSQNDLLSKNGNSTLFDKTIIDFQTKSLFEFGIPQLINQSYTISTMFQLGNGQNTQVFTGNNEKMDLIRVFREYGGQKSITQQKKTINSETLVTQNLWASNVDIYFTDGFQITSGVSSGDTLQVYFPQLRRPVTIQYHKGRVLHDLQVAGIHLDKDWVYPSNEQTIYYNKLTSSGISFNVTEQWGAEVIVTKSRFLDFNDGSYLPVLKDINGALVKADDDRDNVEIWAQKNSGVSVYYNTNLMFNFLMGSDALCYSKQGPYLAPFVTVKSNMEYSKDLINERFPDVASDQEKRNIVRYVLLVIGIIILLVGVAFMIRAIFIKTKRPDMEDDDACEEIIV